MKINIIQYNTKCKQNLINVIWYLQELELIVLNPHIVQAANWFRKDLFAATEGHGTREQIKEAWCLFSIHRRTTSWASSIIPSCVVGKSGTNNSRSLGTTQGSRHISSLLSRCESGLSLLSPL